MESSLRQFETDVRYVIRLIADRRAAYSMSRTDPFNGGKGIFIQLQGRRQTTERFYVKLERHFERTAKSDPVSIYLISSVQ